MKLFHTCVCALIHKTKTLTSTQVVIQSHMAYLVVTATCYMWKVKIGSLQQPVHFHLQYP